MVAVEGPVILWLMFGSWVIHDAEELLIGPGWFDRHETSLRERADKSPTVERFLAAIESNPTAFAVGIGIIGVFVLIATVLGLLDPDGYGMLVYLTILGGYTLHIGVHIAQATVFRGYVPGLVTGILVVLPACGYLYLELFSMGYATETVAAITAVIGLAIVIPTALLAHSVGRRVASAREETPAGKI